MSVERAEWAGTGAAIAFHVALIAAMSMSLAHTASAPEPPSMEVELVDEVGLTAASPAPASPPPASQAPEIGEAEPNQAAPRVEPAPSTPAIRPAPAPRASARPASAKPAARPAPARPTPRASRIGDDFLKGIDGPTASSTPGAAATVSASAMAGIVQAIRRQVQPCADRQVNPGPGASRIRVRLRLQLARNGRLQRPPTVLGTSGVDEENGRFEERVKDLAVATFVGCAPLTGLPPELYETASGRGWSDFIMNYNLP